MTTTTPGACPMHSEFDPLADAYLADPYPVLSGVREEVPAFYAPSVDMWVVTRYDDIQAIFKDPETFSARVVQRPLFPLTEEAQRILTEGFHTTPVMSDCDPPRHTRIRAHNMKGFSHRRTGALEPRAVAKATELVDAIKPGQVDLVSAFTYPLPAYVILNFIGFPDEDMDQIKRWCGNRLTFSWGRPSPEEQREVAHNQVAYWRHCERFVNQRLHEPRDDFASELIRIHREDPEAISLKELIAVVYGLSFAGHETTTNFLGNFLRRLLTHRDQWKEICADQSLIDGAVEEGLRYDSSVIAWRRYTTRPVTVGDVQIPENAKLMLLIGAADRDPSVFADPERFDIHREDAASHLAFGKGIHYCLGAALARIQARTTLKLLTTRAPDITLVPGQELTFPANISFRGPKRLLVDWPG